MLRTRARPKWLQRFILIVKLADVEPIELLESFSLIFFGFLFILPLESFHTSLSFRAIEVLMTSLVPVGGHMAEELWGLIVMAIGALGLVSCLADSKLWRRRSVFIEAVFYFALSVLYFISNPATVATGFFIALSCGAIWIYLRLSE